MKIFQKLLINSFLIISISTFIINDIEAQSIDFEIIGAGNNGEKYENIEIIENKYDFEKKWKGRIFSDKPTPVIDFNKECVIAISRGQCGSSGYGIRIKKVYVDRGYITIEMVYRNPGDSCRKYWAITNPFIIIRLKNKDLDIEFEKTIEVYECNYN